MRGLIYLIKIYKLEQHQVFVICEKKKQSENLTSNSQVPEIIIPQIVSDYENITMKNYLD